jgi:hypothetical protein
MNAQTIDKTRLFWPWQDEKEEAWLEKMSREGWHLHAVKLLCTYTFVMGEPAPYVYRLDYYRGEKSTFPEYLQIFQDAGWEYLGELSNWRYWRKRKVNGDSPEIFSDRQSKIKKYQRLLGVLAFFLIFLVLMGINLVQRGWPWDAGGPLLVTVLYTIGVIGYAVLIPIYMVAVLKILSRIKQLKKPYHEVGRF